jgi:HAE1 family hydrophobic/amphiphilic exporter-1
VPVIAFDVLRAKGSSEVSVAAAVERRVAEVVSAHPRVSVTKIATTVEDTLESYDASIKELLIGAALAALVVFVFLRDWRATLIAAIAMPLSLIPTFLAMSMFGFTLNVITLLGLTLVIGILVDDAIVEVENVVRHSAMGKRPYQAALEASDEIGLAVVATTMTIVVVFVPVSFMSGVAGQYFRQFGITVAVAVLCSLLVARLLTPILAAYFLKPQKEHSATGPLTAAYVGLLRWCLVHRGLSMAVAAAVLSGSAWLASQLPTGFIPTGDRAQVSAALEIPAGATNKEAAAAAAAFTTAVRRHPAVDRVFVDFGAATATGSADLSRGTAIIRLKPRNDREAPLSQIVIELRNHLRDVAGLRVGFLNSQNTRDISIVLVSDSPNDLSAAANALTADMQKLSGLITAVRNSAPLPRAELLVRPRPDEAARLGVTADQIATVVRLSTLGDTDQNVAKFRVDARQIPIRVRLQDRDRDAMGTIGSLKLSTPAGQQVPLRLVADVSLSSGESTVERFNRERRVVIEADLLPGATLGTALEAIASLPAYKALPTSVRQPLTGDAETMAELFGQFGLAMGAGILLIYVVLVLLFKDFMQPLTIMTALPLSLAGAFAGLLLAGMALDLLSLIGLLMLMGIVTKNSILLVEYAIEEVRSGISRTEALVDAGRKRARPILMTTVAMVAGMAFPALGIGPGAELRAPMAVVVIGGLLTSTVLSLIFVPVFFALVDDAEHWLGRRLKALTTLEPGDIDIASTRGTGRASSTEAGHAR